MNWLELAKALAPENILLAGMVVVLTIEIFAPRPRGALAVAFVTVALAMVAALWLYATGFAAEPFPGEFSTDPGSSLAKATILALTLPVLLLSRDEFSQNGPFAVLLMSSLYGVCLMLSADSFLTMFLGVEMLSLPVYVLVLLSYRHSASLEAALKYLVLGGAATATFLLGVSLLYGGTATLALSGFTVAMHASDPMATAAVVLILIAFFLKAAIVPFHAWAPDAYEGATCRSPPTWPPWSRRASCWRCCASSARRRCPSPSWG